MPHVELPDDRWLGGTVDSGPLFTRDGVTSVWDPRAGQVVSGLNLGTGPCPRHGDVIASCGDGTCNTLWLTDARTGSRREVRAPEGRSSRDGAGELSPDGRRLAILISPASGAMLESRLTSRSSSSLDLTIVPESSVPPGYIFTAWSSAGDQVFLAGGERLKRRTIVA